MNGVVRRQAALVSISCVCVVFLSTPGACNIKDANNLQFILIVRAWQIMYQRDRMNCKISLSVVLQAPRIEKGIKIRPVWNRFNMLQSLGMDTVTFLKKISQWQCHIFLSRMNHFPLFYRLSQCSYVSVPCS